MTLLADNEQQTFEGMKPDDLPPPRDSECDRIIQVTVAIPFYGKQAQAEDFVDKVLPRILKHGIGDKAKVTESRFWKVDQRPGVPV